MPDAASSKPHSTDFVQSLERGLAVIRAFDAEHPELSLSDVARATDLPRAAARRFLLTLVELGYVRTDGKLFALRPRILELGYAYLSSIELPDVAQPHMETLVAQIHESCSLSVLDSGDIIYVARVPTRRIMTVAINVGTRFPAYATSMGRVLLAALAPAELDDYLASTDLRALTPKTVSDPKRLRTTLARIASQGFALVDQELEVGLRSIAVPVHGAEGNVVAALNVSMHVGRGSAEAARRELLPHLREAAAAIEADLSAGQPARSGRGLAAGSAGVSGGRL
ncbi:MAG TPA: IclR family transcriptional regulator C-terminal domain-containing protein [Mycobacteriales bacterium]|jgi:IclR family pca regulon transcriptional regulator|nr:IclR family transcriptional regulator C-terminal domain-containing protein [Mycobacteriales bacterium]